jgi:hypothetical protein
MRMAMRRARRALQKRAKAGVEQWFAATILQQSKSKNTMIRR